MARASRKRPAPTPGAQSYATIEEVAPTVRAPDISLACAMWVYTHHPRAWEVKGGRLLPDLSKAMIEDGVNGVRFSERTKKFDLSGLRANLARAGKYIIPLEVDRPVHESYVVRPWPGYCVDRWTTLYPGSKDITRDDESYDEWRASLVDRRIVRDPTYGALQQMLQIRLRVLPRLEAKRGSYAGTLPELEEQIERVKSEIEVVRAALDGRQRPEPGLAAESATLDGLAE